MIPDKSMEQLSFHRQNAEFRLHCRALPTLPNFHGEQ